jgi:hypothetical protein
MSNDVIEQIALVSGRIVHRGTGRPIDGSVRIDAAEGPVIFKLLEDGTFALSANPHSFQKQIAGGSVKLSLTIRARSAEFTTGFVTESVAVTVPVAAFPKDQGVWKLPLVAGAAANLARTIRGIVTEAKNPETPVANATIEILHTGGAIAPASTGADGRFSFGEVVVEAPADIRATTFGFKTQTRQLWIDFTLGMHEEHFRMVSEP